MNILNKLRYFFIISCSTLYSQNNRFIYEYQFKIDSTKDDTQKTIYFLDILKK